MTGGWGRWIAAGLTCTLGAGVAGAQGVNVTGSVSSTFEVDGNELLLGDSEGVTLSWDTVLGATAISETPTTRLEFGIGATLRVEDRAAGEDDNGLVDPTLTFGWRHSLPNAEATANVRYRTNRVVDSFFIDADGDFLEDDLITDEGRIDDTSVSLGFRSGLEGPVGFGLDYSFRDRNYSDTTSPDLFDSTTNTASATARFAINPVIDATTRLTWSEFETDEDDTTRERIVGALGLSYDINPALTVSGEIAYNDIETTETVGFITTTTTETGLSGFIAASRALPNGNVRVSFSNEITSETTRSTLRADRSLALPQGDLSFGIGITGSDTGTTALVGSLEYETELVFGDLAVSLEQDAILNGDEDEVLRTLAEVTLQRELSPDSTLDLGFELGRSEDIGVGDVEDNTAADFTIAYRRELTPDWDWSLGYRARFVERGAGDDGASNTIFTTIERRFRLRP